MVLSIFGALGKFFDKNIFISKTNTRGQKLFEKSKVIIQPNRKDIAFHNDCCVSELEKNCCNKCPDGIMTEDGICLSTEDGEILVTE